MKNVEMQQSKLIYFSDSKQTYDNKTEKNSHLLQNVKVNKKSVLLLLYIFFFCKIVKIRKKTTGQKTKNTTKLKENTNNAVC